MRFDVQVSVVESGRKVPQYTLDTDLNGEISLQELLDFTKKSLIVIADQTLQEEQLQGFDKNPIVVVDGRRNKPVVSVSPFGSIEFISKVSINQIALDTYTAILDRSPVDTGKYKSSHYVFLNGKQVATDIITLQTWLATNPTVGDRDLLRFVNIQPYARKLERLGVTDQRQKSRTVKSKDARQRSGVNGRILAPNGTYFLAARSIRRKYKNNSGIKFGFISGSSLGIAGSFSGAGKRQAYLYPTISILVQGGGIE